MKIKRLYINNYKSLVDFELVEPNPFSVFVGPNAAGKSNIFEALEFLSYANDIVRADDIFGGASDYLNRMSLSYIGKEKNSLFDLTTYIEFENFDIESSIKYLKSKERFEVSSSRNIGARIQLKENNWVEALEQNDKNISWYIKTFSRVFINNKDLVRYKTSSSEKLRIDAANLASVLKRIIEDPLIKEEIIEWLQLLIPEFEDLQISRDNISGIDTLLVKEKHTKEYFKKDLLSDGTYNILSLLTAVYQSDEPQFLCIEEPENGLTPFVIYEMVNLFRQLCEEKGHYIWLNTHSPYLVRQLLPKEIILIDKKEGITRAKQIDKDLHFKTMKLDEAWLSNTLGGGLPW